MHGLIRRLAVGAGLALAAAMIPAAGASAASAGCTTSGNQVTCVFTETGGAQTWTVPPGITSAAFTLYGAEGSAPSGNSGGSGGLGAKVTATLSSLSPSSVLQVNVGQAGGTGGAAFGGGGNGAGGGGGASDVRSPAADGSYPLANRLLVAGGGGGGGSNVGAVPGGGGPGGNADSGGIAGANITDGNGYTLGAGGGGGAGMTGGPGAGGAGGAVTGVGTCSGSNPVPGSAGTSGDSQGNGGSGGASSGLAGGGGGGGYFGGGGGGSAATDISQQCPAFPDTGGAAGGGGGASYTGGVTGAAISDGVAAPDDAANGEVIIVYSVAPPLALTTTSLPDASTGGFFYDEQLQATGGTTPYTWSVVPGSGNLPPGLSLNTSNGLISGFPTTLGVFSFTVQVADASTPQMTATESVSITVTPPPLRVTSLGGSLPDGQAGEAYFNVVLQATGGTTPYTWSVVSGSLPPGMSLSSGGVFSGTPTAQGTFSFTAQVADSSSPQLTATVGLSITVDPPPLFITSSVLPDAQTGTFYSQTLAATGGTTPYIWTALDELPPGLSLSPDGVLSGTPTTAGYYAFNVHVLDSSSSQMTAIRQVSVLVRSAPLAVTTASLPGATLGSAYSQTLAAAGGSTPYAWSVSSGSLPPGLSLSPAGVISGRPVLAGTFGFTVQTADSSSPQQTATATLSLTVGVGAGGTTITGTHSGSLTITGVTSLDHATITGTLTIAAGAVVSISGSTLKGPLKASGAASVTVCGTSISSSPASVSGTTGPVLLGGTSGSPCGADSVGGPVSLTGNTGGVVLAGTTITGPASLTGNTGGTVVAGNTIGGPLACSGNNPAPTDNGQPNVVKGPAGGQCSTLA